MLTPFDAAFVIIGHRGAAGLEPENTLRSFRRAVALGVAAVEFDIHRVGNTLVVIHDERLERTTNGRGVVSATPLETLRGLDAGAGEHVPTLDEAFAAIPSHIGVNVELKGIGTGAAFARQLPAHRSRLLVSSFRHDELGDFRENVRDVAVAPLYRRRAASMAATARALEARFVNLSLELATPARIETLAAAGFGVLVYTVNDPDVAARLEGLGVRGVFTDRPDLVRRPACSTGSL